MLEWCSKFHLFPIPRTGLVSFLGLDLSCFILLFAALLNAHQLQNKENEESQKVIAMPAAFSVAFSVKIISEKRMVAPRLKYLVYVDISLPQCFGLQLLDSELKYSTSYQDFNWT